MVRRQRFTSFALIPWVGAFLNAALGVVQEVLEVMGAATWEMRTNVGQYGLGKAVMEYEHRGESC